jgi:hypothetical protein
MGRFVEGSDRTELRAGRTEAPRLAVPTPLRDVVEALNAYQPDALITYPSFVRRMVTAYCGHVHLGTWLTPQTTPARHCSGGGRNLTGYLPRGSLMNGASGCNFVLARSRSGWV